MRGTVFSIEEFATFDGPGIRMTVFMKGCPLSCVWCHNPEGQNPAPEFMRSPNGCVNCRACERVAKRENNSLIFTKESQDVCPRSLIKICGIEYEARELCDRILKNARVLKMNGGGVTFSGGEPLFSYEFIKECFEILDGKVHRALQTTGFCEEDKFAEILKTTDYVLYDLKLFDQNEHIRYCGVSNQVILQNYRTLVRSGVDFITRIPLIPSVTDKEENLTSIAKFMSALGVKRVEVLPYNKLAGAKYASLLREYNVDFDESKEVNTGKGIFNAFGIEHKVM
ncbi:MAG: glycyl-radical enzyme activating protein [Clostridia bacterium]|nr:glycyl-radical enzyme activating protein [Clostridia bacterium]